MFCDLPSTVHPDSMKEYTTPIPLSFYIRPSRLVAPALLGCMISRETKAGVISGIIVETEAYHQDDPASHSYRGPTSRNEVMFQRGGYLYVYFTYGMHYCANVVTGKRGTGEAVLIRAVEPVEGIELMKRNRGASTRLNDLTSGPARFCEAFGIEREHNGTDLRSGPIRISRGAKIPPGQIGTSPRIGIRVGTDKHWRFFIKENLFVSRGVPSGR